MRITCLLLLMTIASPFCLGQDAKPDKSVRIIAAAPLAIPAGSQVRLALRGLKLDELTSLTLQESDAKVDVISKGKATVPQNYEAQRVGDTQAEVTFTLAESFPPGPLHLIAANADGTASTYAIQVVPAADLIAEKEPNDGFKSAQRIELGKTVTGTIHDPRNVDVFEFAGQAGQKVVIRVTASQVGSPLDPFLTLFDADGQIIAGNDDRDGRDPRLEFTLTRTGSYFVAVQDANDSGGPHFAYLLKVTP